MNAVSVLKFLPQVCSCVSKFSSGSLGYLVRKNRQAIIFHQARRFSLLSDISPTDPTLGKHIDVIEEKYSKALSENGTFDLNLGAEFEDSVNINLFKNVLEEIALVKRNMIAVQELNPDKNKEMDALVKEEMKEYKNQLTELKNQLLKTLIPKDAEESFKSIIIEVTAGVGGQEAMLFAADILDMYSNYATYRGWKISSIELNSSDLGGVRRACILISGDECTLLRFEGGVHRVQRVPKTEKSGRVHTSTVSVAVLPEPKETDVTIADKDLKIETKRASGPGGQSVQKSESAVRIVHLPTGIAVECQEERTQLKNKALALKKLRALLYEKEKEEKESKISSSRKIQVGSKGRSEKIRTYNFNQDRITDHRIGKNMFNLISFLEGGPALEEMIRSLHCNYKKEQLEIVLEFIASR